MRPAPPRFPVIRPPRPRVVVTVAAALLAALLAHRATSTAAVLGETTVVAVVTAEVEVGGVLEPDDVDLVERPTVHVPDAAVTSDPTGRTTRVALVPGEVLVADRLAPPDRRGPGALVPEGWRAVAVPVLDARIPAGVGDLVDVVAAYDPAVVPRDPTLVIAADAVVVDVDDEAITVAVPRSRVTEVAFALANGIVTLALVG